MKKTVIYCRVSTREQVDYGYSIRDQEEKLINYCKVILGLDKKELKILLEEGASAGTLKRPKIQELIKMIKKGKVERVIIHNLDRMFRNMKDFIEVIDLFEKHNVSLVSLRENIETETAMGKFQISIIVLIAEWERETIRERTLRGLDKSAKEGNYSLGGPAPFGYDRVNKKLVKNPIQSAQVKEMFKLMETGKYSATNVLRQMKKEHDNLKNWSDSQIRKALTNRIYLGEFSNGRIVVPNHSPKIVDLDTFNTVQQNLKSRSYLVKHTYIAKGLIKCYSCSNMLIPEPAYNKNAKLYKYYYCKKCKQRVSENHIDALVKDSLNSIASIEANTINLRDFKRSVAKEESLNQMLIDGIVTNDEFLLQSHKISKEKEYIFEHVYKQKNKIITYYNASIGEKRKIIKETLGIFEYDFKSSSIKSELIK